ncbi:MAG TPA: HAD hydrolase family protein [Terriglobales bacterium]|jgi:3-deoxy-D-manno-octulosonate 8-phosphate phosphatase (KDO 8-P phosphatase)
MPTPDAVARARSIRLILFDVDGVLTDGVLWYVPAGDQHGLVEVKGFSAHDGIGIALARRAGLKTGVITKRRSESLAMRARDLRMDYVYQGVDRKAEALQEIWRASGCAAAETCCMGDDIVDLPMLRAAGLAAAPANARPEVAAAAHFVAPHAGGQGAARDLVEFILRAQGVFDDVVRRWIAAPESDYVPGNREPGTGNSGGENGV